jgi:hypothetical protein
MKTATTRVPQLYRGTSPGVRYTGFDWKAETYLTDDFETAAIYARLGRIERATLTGDARLVLAEDVLVRSIEEASNPADAARGLGVDVVWNPSSRWVGRVHPHEFIVFVPSLIRFDPVTKAEQKRAADIARMLSSP